jgi:hypothetical protein
MKYESSNPRALCPHPIKSAHNPLELNARGAA